MHEYKLYIYRQIDRWLIRYIIALIYNALTKILTFIYMIKKLIQNSAHKTSEFIFALRIFTKIDHMLNDKAIPNTFQKTETTQNKSFYDR